MDTDLCRGIRVLWRRPETLCLIGIPYEMRPGQSPNDLWRAAHEEGPRSRIRDWVWLGSPGWWGSKTREEIEWIKQFLDAVEDVPSGPGEWCPVTLKPAIERGVDKE